jgi:hypothetical protein
MEGGVEIAPAQGRAVGYRDPRMILRLSHFFFAATLIFGLNVLSLYTVSDTVARFADVESSNGNVFESTELNLTLSDTAFEGSVGSEVDESHFSTIVGAFAGGGVLYELRYAYDGGALCDALAINASGGGTSYTGFLSDFTVATTTELGLWEFSVGLGGAEVETDALCTFDLVYQARLATTPTGGYEDEERFRVNIIYHNGAVPPVSTPFLPLAFPEEVLLTPDAELSTDDSLMDENMGAVPTTPPAEAPPDLPLEEIAKKDEGSLDSLEENVVPGDPPVDPPTPEEEQPTVEDVVFVPITPEPPVSEPEEPVIEF